jgi:hypothetical protein
VLVFDGDCGFCRFWAAPWRHRTGDRVAYEPFQNATIRDLSFAKICAVGRTG